MNRDIIKFTNHNMKGSNMSAIAIIGGGASGLIAAICGARNGSTVTIYEKNDRLGKKLIATGNGRCNLSNAYAGQDDYHGESTRFIQNAIESFWVEETLSFFSEIGLLTKTEDDGKIYPYCDRAGAVLDILRMELDRLGVTVNCGFDVESVIKRKTAFEIVSYDGRHEFADKVIVTAGGKAAPNLGGGGSGYDILKTLGHHITPLQPSIVQLRTDTAPIAGLKGVKCYARVSLGDTSYTGELLFTEYGVSGPPVFSVSSYLIETPLRELKIDFFDGYSENELFRIMMNKAEISNTVEELFTGILHKNIGRAILKKCGYTDLTQSCSFKAKELRAICETAKCFTVDITGTQSWNNAQVTSGGVKTSEFNPESLMSLKCPGLYAAGEILDIDGNCGGYNLQWAWSSGYIAGTHASTHE